MPLVLRRPQGLAPAALGLFICLVAASCGDDASDSAESATTVRAVSSVTSSVAGSVPTLPATTAPPATAPATAPKRDAVEILTSLAITASEVGTDIKLGGPPHDLRNSPKDLKPIVASTPSCSGLTDLVPVPYSTLASAGRLDYLNSQGDAGSSYIVVMPDEAGAQAYMRSIRAAPAFASCLLEATATWLTETLPTGVTIAVDKPHLGASLPGFGDDQVITTGDLVVGSNGTELLRVPSGERYSRIGNVILVANGASFMDRFAPVMFNRTAAIVRGGST